MPKIISVVDKPVADTVSDEAYFLGIQDNGEGKQALCRMPYDKVCRQLNSLTDEDIQTVKNAALGEVTKAAQNAQSISDDLKKRADNGDFNGKDYKLTPDDINEIAEKAATLAGAMQGGTVTYKIPKEYYQTDFTDDNYSSTKDNGDLANVVINCGKITIPEQKINEDIEAGIVEFPENFDELPEKEQDAIYCEIYEKYAKYDLKPWIPPRRSEHSWLWEFICGGNFALDYDSSYICLNVALFWTNSFKMLLKAECDEIEKGKTFAFSSNDYITNGFLSFASGNIEQSISFNNMFPFLVVGLNENVETGDMEATLNLCFSGLNPQYLIANPNILSGSWEPLYVKNDDVKEITISFMPNNAYVEEYENEEI